MSKLGDMASARTFTLLGTGTSSGVPFIGCRCKVCKSKNPKNKRLRASAWLRTPELSLLIDTSTDLRQQALREKITHVDAVLYTHPHADHVYGIDEMRSFNFIQKASIPVYGNAWTRDELLLRFDYIFNPPKKLEGGGVPQLILHTVTPEMNSIRIKNLEIIPLWVKHGSKDTLGYRIDSIAYLTDCSYIPEPSIERLKNLSVLVLDCLRIERHDTHFNLEQALELIDRVRPKKTFLTHLNHDFDDRVWSKKLPKGVALAYDGLKIKF